MPSQIYLTIIIVLRNWGSTEYTLRNAVMETHLSYSAEVQSVAEGLTMNGGDQDRGGTTAQI